MKNFGSIGLKRVSQVLLLLAISAIPNYLVAQTPRLTIRIDSTKTCPYGHGYASIYLTNPLDSVAGFMLWVQVSNYKLIALSSSIDTVGTTINGFASVEGHSVGVPGNDVLITALANTGQGGSPIPPDSMPRLLCRIPYSTLDSSLAMFPATALNINSMSLDKFSFVDPNGQTIGMTADSIPQVDTVQVKVHDGAVAVENSGDVNGDGIVLSVADYVALERYIGDESFVLSDPRNADVNGDCVIDCHDAEVFEQNMFCEWSCGPYVTCTCDNPVRGACCCGMRGNVTYSFPNTVNIMDLTFLVSYLFAHSTAPLCTEMADVNASGSVTIMDLTRLVSYLFNHGPAPAMCP